MSLVIRTTGQPVGLKVNWTDQAADVITDVTAQVITVAGETPADDPSKVTFTDNGDGTCTIGPDATGDAVNVVLSATGVNPDGTSVTAAPFGVSIVAAQPDATAGTFEVVSNPNP